MNSWVKEKTIVLILFTIFMALEGGCRTGDNRRQKEGLFS